jgi:hypothetical protein
LKSEEAEHVEEARVLPGGGVKEPQAVTIFIKEIQRLSLCEQLLCTTPSKSAKVYCDIRVVDYYLFVVVVVAAAATAAVCCTGLTESLAILKAICLPPWPATASFI